jgi:hypothetical protein
LRREVSIVFTLILCHEIFNDILVLSCSKRFGIKFIVNKLQGLFVNFLDKSVELLTKGTIVNLFALLLAFLLQIFQFQRMTMKTAEHCSKLVSLLGFKQYPRATLTNHIKHRYNMLEVAYMKYRHTKLRVAKVTRTMDQIESTFVTNTAFLRDTKSQIKRSLLFWL